MSETYPSSIMVCCWLHDASLETGSAVLCGGCKFPRLAEPTIIDSTAVDVARLLEDLHQCMIPTFCSCSVCNLSAGVISGAAWSINPSTLSVMSLMLSLLNKSCRCCTPLQCTLSAVRYQRHEIAVQYQDSTRSCLRSNKDKVYGMQTAAAGVDRNCHDSQGPGQDVYCRWRSSGWLRQHITSSPL